MNAHSVDTSPSATIAALARNRVPVEATLIARPNRFVAIARLEQDAEQVYGTDRAGSEITAHVADPGRLVELLVPGAKVYVMPAFPKEPGDAESDAAKGSAGRKTAYDLALVDKDGVLVSVDSRVPNELIHRALQIGFFPELSAYSRIQRESTFGNSRLDFRLSAADQHRVDGETETRDRPEESSQDSAGADCLIEVKSVTLVNDGVAMFPDAPTARGARHMRELAQARTEGFRAIALFVIQRRDVSAFVPNRAMDPEFADALNEAVEAGVEVWAWRCDVSLERIALDMNVPVNV